MLQERLGDGCRWCCSEVKASGRLLVLLGRVMLVSSDASNFFNSDLSHQNLWGHSAYHLRSPSISVSSRQTDAVTGLSRIQVQYNTGDRFPRPPKVLSRIVPALPPDRSCRLLPRYDLGIGHLDGYDIAIKTREQRLPMLWWRWQEKAAGSIEIRSNHWT